MQFSIQSDINKAARYLGAMQKQIPFAASVALNKTAERVKRVEQATIKTELHNPRPNTVKAIRVQRSNKRRLNAAVFVLPALDRFIGYQVEGGTRRPDGRAIAVPVNIKLNKYGNIPGRRSGKLNKLLAKNDTFSATINGVAGIWQRYNKGRRLRLLASYQDKTSYRPRWRFYHHARRTAAKVWPLQFRRAIMAAIRTAR